MGLKVLVIDDDGSFRQLLEVALGMEAPVEEVRSAADGPEAIRLLDEFQPDIVFVDSLLPQMPGEEVCIRLEESVPEARIISLSGMPENHEQPEQAKRRERVEKDTKMLETLRGIVHEAAGS